MARAKEVSTEMAAKLAAKAKTSLTKTYEQSKEKVAAYIAEETRKIKEELKELENDQASSSSSSSSSEIQMEKMEISSESAKNAKSSKSTKKSFFSRALKWTKALAKEITEEYQKETSLTQSVNEKVVREEVKEVKKEKEKIKEETPVIEEHGLEEGIEEEKEKIKEEKPVIEEKEEQIEQIVEEKVIEKKVIEKKVEEEEEEEEDIKLVSLKGLETDDMVKLAALTKNPTVAVYPLNEVQTASGIIGGVSWLLKLQIANECSSFSYPMYFALVLIK